MERLGLPPTAFPLILRLLWEDNISQEELADDFLVDKGTIARTLVKLEEAGYVTRSVDDKDRRVKRVRVTDKARELEPELRAAGYAWDEKLLDSFNSHEKQAVLGFLERMAENAREHWEDLGDAPVANLQQQGGTQGVDL